VVRVRAIDAEIGGWPLGMADQNGFFIQ